eukprot:g74405.t1
MIKQQIHNNYRILTAQAPCIAHKMSEEGYFLPAQSSSLRLQFHKNLQYVCFREPSSRAGKKLPFSAFRDACMGFYSPHCNGTQENVNHPQVDPAKVLTLFFHRFKPLYIEMDSREAADNYLKALLWLKLFLDRSVTSQEPPQLAPGTLYHEVLYLISSRKSKPALISVVFGKSSDTIDFVPLEGRPAKSCVFRKRVPRTAIHGIDCGRESDVFGVMKWVFSLRLKDNQQRCLHFGLADHHRLVRLTEALRSLTSIAPSCSKPFPRTSHELLRVHEDVFVKKAAVSFHYVSTQPTIDEMVLITQHGAFPALASPSHPQQSTHASVHVGLRSAAARSPSTDASVHVDLQASFRGPEAFKRADVTLDLQATVTSPSRLGHSERAVVTLEVNAQVNWTQDQRDLARPLLPPTEMSSENLCSSFNGGDFKDAFSESARRQGKCKSLFDITDFFLVDVHIFMLV